MVSQTCPSNGPCALEIKCGASSIWAVQVAVYCIYIPSFSTAVASHAQNFRYVDLVASVRIRHDSLTRSSVRLFFAGHDMLFKRILHAMMVGFGKLLPSLGGPRKTCCRTNCLLVQPLFQHQNLLPCISTRHDTNEASATASSRQCQRLRTVVFGSTAKDANNVNCYKNHRRATGGMK